MTAIVPSGTPLTSISMTFSTSETKRAVPLTSCLAWKTLSPLPTMSRPCSSVSCLPEGLATSSGLYLSGCSFRDAVADISKRYPVASRSASIFWKSSRVSSRDWSCTASSQDLPLEARRSATSRRIAVW